MQHIAMVPLIGGMALGAEQALGTPPKAVLSYSAFDLNDSYYMAYLQKRGLDISRYLIDEDTIPNFGEIDVVTSVCPCSGLSAANRTAGAGCQANEWMYKSTEYALDKIRPKALIGENAPRLYGKSGVGVSHKLRDIAEMYGYSLQLVKTSTHLHGIPQKRERSFFIAWKDSLPYHLTPQKAELEHWTDYLARFEGDDSPVEEPNRFNEALWELVELKGFDKKQVVQDLAKINGSLANFFYDNRELTTSIIEEFADDPGAKGRVARRFVAMREKEERLPGCRFYDNSPVFKDKPWYGSVMFRSLIAQWHPKEIRPITMREAMRLMGLPEDMDLPLIKHKNAICQNVPTCTAAWIAQSVAQNLRARGCECTPISSNELDEDSIFRWSNLSVKTQREVSPTHTRPDFWSRAWESEVHSELVKV